MGCGCGGSAKFKQQVQARKNGSKTNSQFYSLKKRSIEKMDKENAEEEKIIEKTYNDTYSAKISPEEIENIKQRIEKRKKRINILKNQ